MNNLSKNLKELMNKYGMSQYDLASELNLPRTTISGIINAQSIDPRYSTVETIAKYFGLTPQALMSENSILKSSHEKIKQVSHEKLISTFDIGDVKKILDFVSGKNISCMKIQVEETLPEDCFGIIYSGMAMFPLIIEKMITIVSPINSSFQNKDLVLVYKSEINEFLIRKLLIESGEKILQPENPNFQQHQLKPFDKIIGKIIQSRFFY